MTTEELKKKIDRMMFGLHSTNPGDINALPEILNELVDMAGQGGGGGGTVVKLTAPFNNQDNYTKAQMAALIGVSEADLDIIMEGAADTILEVTEEIDDKGTAVTLKSFIRTVSSTDVPSVGFQNVVYDSWDENNEYHKLTLAKDGDSYTINSTYAPTM